jgi:hypothetical protein
MPIDTGLTDAILVKLFHLGKTDREIADQYGVTVQAVSKRRVKLDLIRKPVSRQVNEWLATRWQVFSPQEGTGHHNRYSAKALRVWLRRRLGDDTLSAKQIDMADRWERRLRREGTVLCYDPTTEEGWYYRFRTKADNRLVIDWPRDLPFPDERFRRALELPLEGAANDV